METGLVAFLDACFEFADVGMKLAFGDGLAIWHRLSGSTINRLRSTVLLITLSPLEYQLGMRNGAECGFLSNRSSIIDWCS